MDMSGTIRLRFTDPTGQFPENPYDLIPESGWTGIAYVGNFAAGFGDTVTLGGTNSVWEWMGINGVVNPCSSVYFAGDVTGTVVPMLMGGVGFARGALAMGGTKGIMVTRLGKGTGRFFYDNRTWGSVSRIIGEHLDPQNPITSITGSFRNALPEFHRESETLGSTKWLYQRDSRAGWDIAKLEES